MVRLLTALLLIASLSAACGDSSEPETSAGADSDRVVTIDVPSAEHVLGDVSYATSPPAGGDHFGAWQNCGFYTVPLRNEVAVHSLEHGGVWVTYLPDTADETLDAIETEIGSESHLFASPYEGQESQLILTAWGRQLEVESWDDPEVARFLNDHLGRRSPTAPEPGASCAGAIGFPPDDALANYDAAVASMDG